MMGEIKIGEFRRYMQCGLGRCALILRNTGNKERYQKILLWGCTHPLTRLIILNGTRSCYLYGLLELFGEREYFLRHILPLSRSVPPRSIRCLRSFVTFSHCLRRTEKPKPAQLWRSGVRH